MLSTFVWQASLANAAAVHARSAVSRAAPELVSPIGQCWQMTLSLTARPRKLRQHLGDPASATLTTCRPTLPTARSCFETWTEAIWGVVLSLPRRQWRQAWTCSQVRPVLPSLGQASLLAMPEIEHFCNDKILPRGRTLQTNNLNGIGLLCWTGKWLGRSKALRTN